MAKRTLSPAQLLQTYRAKRDFTKTREPSGAKVKPAAAAGSYLIQKHAARRLHYDFRLEMHGVLKSWAVTRGPSLDPADKRLAVHVEDHPLDYGTFEGTIPHGEYGGGTVMLWDQGSWQPVGDIDRAYAKGHLTFILHGRRLKGEWHLVRMGKRAQGGKHENWLLIKGHDEYANTKNGDFALEHYQTSVTTDRLMPQITGGAKQKKSPKPAAKSKSVAGKTAAKKSRALPPPAFIIPQLATLVTTPPAGDNWIHEIKFDGYRLQARIDDGEVTMTTRANNDWTAKFDSLAKALATLKIDNALIDGEAVSMAEDGTMSFHGLQNALSTGNQDRMQYYAFDLLYLNGQDLRDKPLLERKEILKNILAAAPPNIRYSEHFTDPGNKVLSHACAIALEGIVSKQADAAYHSGRDLIWLKSKCTREQEIVIGGYTMQPKHPDMLGALLTGYYEKGNFIFAGKTGTGFSQEEGRIILKKLRALDSKTSLFKAVPAAARSGAHWVKPKLVAQIHFSEWTPDGMMRHPSYQGLREDKPASEVVREKPKLTEKTVVPAAAASKGKETIAGVTLTHPDKKLYAGDTITKREVAEYYQQIAPLMLPHIVGRPISLMRCPSGEGKPCFFQRHGSDMLSPYVKPVHIDGKGKDEPYLMIEDLRGLVGLVQMGVLEIHAWGGNAKDPDRPDRITFDLDPSPEVPWVKVKAAAQEIRQRLKKLKLASFLKSTGGKGLHIVVPFDKGPSWEKVKTFSLDLAKEMVGEQPELFTTNSRFEARKGKIFIDYLRNGKGASAIAAYSTRARKNAPIAAPLDWSELATLKSGHEVTVRNAAKNLRKDPWKAMLTLKQKLPV